jgi:hypothetical protein
MMERLRSREQERTAAMVRRQMDTLTSTLATQRDVIKQHVCDDIRQSMVCASIGALHVFPV